MSANTATKHVEEFEGAMRGLESLLREARMAPLLISTNDPKYDFARTLVMTGKLYEREFPEDERDGPREYPRVAYALTPAGRATVEDHQYN